jgi:hypothetical protein
MHRVLACLLIASCTSTPIDIPTTDDHNSPRIALAGAGEMLLDVTSDGQDALVIEIATGDLSIVPIAGGAAVEVGSIGADPDGFPFGSFAPGNADEVFAVSWSGSTPEPTWIGSRDATLTQVGRWAAGVGFGPTQAVVGDYAGDVPSTTRLIVVDLTQTPFAIAPAVAAPDLIFVRPTPGGTVIAATWDGVEWTLAPDPGSQLASNVIVDTSLQTVSGADVVGGDLIMQSGSPGVLTDVPAGGTARSFGCGIFYPFEVTSDRAQVMFNVTDEPGCTPTLAAGNYLWDPTSTEQPRPIALPDGDLLDDASRSRRYVATTRAIYDEQAADPTVPIQTHMLPSDYVFGPGETSAVYEFSDVTQQLNETIIFGVVSLPSGTERHLQPTAGNANVFFLDDATLVAGGSANLDGGPFITSYDLVRGKGTVLDDDNVFRVLRAGTTRTIVYTTGTTGEPAGVWAITVP